MRGRGGGAIVNIVSIYGREWGGSYVRRPTYIAAKAAEIGMSKALAMELAPLGIRVNIVNPDAVFQDSALWTEYVRAARAAAHGVAVDDLPDFYRQRNLLQVPVYGEDVAEAALYFATDRSRYVTGTVLPVDGGTVAGKVIMRNAPTSDSASQ